MIKNFQIPYGRSLIEFCFKNYDAVEIQPKIIESIGFSQSEIVRAALARSSIRKLSSITPFTTIGIGINDQSRPIPHSLLLPALLEFLKENGAQEENITLYVATGTHTPVSHDVLKQIVGEKIFGLYKVISHDCDNEQNLKGIGTTTRSTPVFVNKAYFDSDIKIVVGNIESHHFMGFSGGYKTAAIGLASRRTITANHALLSNPRAKMGLFLSNPMRCEVEEIGQMIGVDIAMNVVLSPEKKILACFCGHPGKVMEEGIRYIHENIQQDLQDALAQFDLVIASAGGYPKDINFYQAQKALTHACLFAKPGGKILLAAECVDGLGSDKFETFISSRATPAEIIEDFAAQPFEIGPHKAYQLARQISDYGIGLVSGMARECVNRLKLKYFPDIQTAILNFTADFPRDARIAVLPYATATLPKISEE